MSLAQLTLWPFQRLVDGALAGGLGVGLAIIVSLVLVRVIVFPLAYRQARSVWVMAGLGPRVRAILEGSEQDPEAARAQLVALYRAERVSPFGALVAIIPQALVLLGLYLALSAHFTGESGLVGIGALDARAREGLAGVILIVIYAAGFVGAIWLNARRNPVPVSWFTRAMMLAVPVGALGALPLTTNGLALYLAVTAALSVIQAWVLLIMFAPRPAAPA